MSYGRAPAETWDKWRETSRAAAEQRWKEAQKLGRPQMAGDKWIEETRRRLVRLTELGILQAREQSRVAEIHHRKLAAADQDRLKQSGLTRDLFAFAVASSSAAEPERLADRFLQLNSGTHLHGGKLSFQVFIKDGLPVGMNIQLRGTDPARANRPTYLRYDLDAVPMGEKTGPVAHFSAHWHAGDDPNAGDAEDHDPRLPSLVLDPLAVLDVLIETFFPRGPDDVLPPSPDGAA